MVTTLILIRHGETEGADQKRYKGSIDVPLSENGIRQIEKLSRFISTEAQECSVRKLDSSEYRKSALCSVYCSDLSRAIKSAEIIAAPYSLSPVIVPELRERNFGIWEGMSFDEIKEKYPVQFESWASNPLKFSPMQGESTAVMSERVMLATEKILAHHKGERLAIVSHGGVIRIILCCFLGIPLENIFRIEQDYAALNIVEIWDNYPLVKLLNGIVYD
jgi:alpha-ribazole phosphatase